MSCSSSTTYNLTNQSGPLAKDFLVVRGDLFRISVTLLNKDRTPKDITGYIGKMEIKANPNVELIATIPDPLEGKLVYELDPDDSAVITPGVYKYGIEYSKTVAGPDVEDRREVFHGNFTVLQQRVD